MEVARNEGFAVPLALVASPSRKIPQPFPYQGSKRKLAATILSLLPPAFGRLVEPFAGSAAVSLAAAAGGRASEYHLSDAHEPVAMLWRDIAGRPSGLADEYEDLWHRQAGRERMAYDEIRAEFNATGRPACFLYVLGRCAQAVVRYNAKGEFNNSPDNRRKGSSPALVRSRIAEASSLLAGRVRIASVDYREAMRACGAGGVAYLDPPYCGVGGKRNTRYATKFDRNDFLDALARFVADDVAFLLSYDGRTGERTYGDSLPATLGLVRVEVPVGRSSQETLCGRDGDTFESLYLSPALAERVAGRLASVRIDPSHAVAEESPPPV